MTDLVRIPLGFDDEGSLREEVSQNLSKGRTFARGISGIAMWQRCRLILTHPGSGAQLELVAKAVWIQCEGPTPGIGFEVVDLNPALVGKLEQFVSSTSAVRAEAPSVNEAAEGAQAGRAKPRNVYDKIRRLSLRDQQAMARSGGYTERVALERCFGGAVWESLLCNPQLTGAEAAKIAKKGGLPRPLVVQIVSNNAWLAVPEVQRALLGNPRLGVIEIVKVLRALPRHALNQVSQQSAYRAVVRAEAKKLLMR